MSKEHDKRGYAEPQVKPLRRAKLCGQDGFTLVEVLVAFTVLALLTIAVQRGVMTAVVGTDRANGRIGAELVARTLMTAPLSSGPDADRPQSGQMNGYAWRLRFEPVELPFSTSMTSNGRPPEWVPLRMVINVANDRRGQGMVTTETVRLVKTTLE